MSRYSYATSPILCPLCKRKINLKTFVVNHLKLCHKDITYDIKRELMEIVKNQAWRDKTKNNII